MENENWGEDIISLMDEEGNQSEYKIVACAEMDGTEYMALEPIIEDPEEALMDAADPIMAVEHGCIVSKDADITVAFRVTLPEVFSVSSTEYEAMHAT